MPEHRSVRFPESAWQEIQALPQPLRERVLEVAFRLSHEPVPALADPFPLDDPVPGAYELRLPADGMTIWYVVHEHQGKEVIAIQSVRPNA